MRRYFLLLFTGLVLGGIAGFAGGIFTYPYLFLDDIVATEVVSDEPSRTVVAAGRFVHANPSDPIHHGTGGVKVYEDLLHLERATSKSVPARNITCIWCPRPRSRRAPR